MDFGLQDIVLLGGQLLRILQLKVEALAHPASNCIRKTEHNVFHLRQSILFNKHDFDRFQNCVPRLFC